MDKIIYLIIAATIFILAGISMISLSSDAITDVFSFSDDARSSNCELQCSRIESGETSPDSYTLSCQKKYECDAADENSLLLQHKGLKEALTN